MSKLDHNTRVREELIKVGLSNRLLSKMSIKYLPKLIEENENIGGVIYGVYEKNNLAILVATDRRLIFVHRRPFYTTTDEISYNVVSGVKESNLALLAMMNVTLHTRIQDYSFRYVSPKAARVFVDFINRKILETDIHGDTQSVLTTTKTREPLKNTIGSAAYSFLSTHRIAVLSTVGRTGIIHGATVFYLLYKDSIYILTKSETNKAKDVISNSQVALTVTEEKAFSTLQITANAEIEVDQQTKDHVFHTISRPVEYNGKMQEPPVVQLTEGMFTVIRLTILDARFTDFKKASK
jgi:general stress protein 26